MTNPQKKNLDSPDDTRNFDKGKMQIVNVGDAACGRFVFQPGWKWSESVKPLVKTDSCQLHHTVYIISGRIMSRMTDGIELELGPGDFGVIPSGHDAWIVGNEPCVGLDFTGAKTFAK